MNDVDCSCSRYCSDTFNPTALGKQCFVSMTYRPLEKQKERMDGWSFFAARIAIGYSTWDLQEASVETRLL